MAQIMCKLAPNASFNRSQDLHAQVLECVDPTVRFLPALLASRVARVAFGPEDGAMIASLARSLLRTTPSA